MSAIYEPSGAPAEPKLEGHLSVEQIEAMYTRK
jgi:hypothetical protein